MTSKTAVAPDSTESSAGAALSPTLTSASPAFSSIFCAFAPGWTR
jgi:hypothetical protein